MSKYNLYDDFFGIDHDGLTDREYYQKRINETYVYGRGTSREETAVTLCECVITCPQEIKDDHSKIERFYKGVYDFISNRYGAENMVCAAVHFDEVKKRELLRGTVHGHFDFTPIVELDHEQVQYKTIRTQNAIQTETGRYIFEKKFVLDENGNKIKLNNYSHMTDYYDTKLDACTLLNKAELQHFHKDLQKYLDDNGIEGKILTGTTGGVNYSIKELKEFTERTGLRREDVDKMLAGKSILESYVESQTRIHELEQTIENKDIYIESLERSQTEEKTYTEQAERSDKIEYKTELENLHETVTQQEKTIENLSGKNEELQRKLDEAEKQIENKNKEVERVRLQAEEAKKEESKNRSWSREETNGWGTSSARSWEAQRRSEWDQNIDRTEKTYEV